MEFGSLGQGLSGGYLNTVPPNATREEQIAAINDIIGRLNSMLKAQSYSDGENKRYIQGYAADRWPGGDFGIAISKEGEDVYDANFDDLLFAWDFSTNKQYYNGGEQLFTGGSIVLNDGTNNRLIIGHQQGGF